MVESKQGFHLSKWFLDFTCDNGEAMIFYSAKLDWHGFKASYTSWLHYQPSKGVSVKSRFANINTPILNENTITWNDPAFGIQGEWQALSGMIEARLFESTEGYLDWQCFQPASLVKLQYRNNSLHGKGYAEKLILTVPPWKIPMDELRWGRFISPTNNLVWIELKKNGKKQWLWHNNNKIEDCSITDDTIALTKEGINLKLDQQITLESEKKIQSVVGKLVRFLPGFTKIIPLGFLMADETKWLSGGESYCDGKLMSSGIAIHEFVKFN